jgi:hypothetical protein
VSRRRFRTLTLALAAAAVVLNVAKALPTFVHDLGWPYWSLTYRHGFIRRGLVGTIFQWFAGTRDEALEKQQILVLHTLAVLALFGACVAWGVHEHRRARDERTRLALETGLAALLLGQALPTLGLVAGYLDVYVFLVVLAGAWLAARGRLIEAAVVGSMGPFVHDGFVFAWAAVLAAYFVSRPATWRKSLPLLAPVATTALVLLLHSKHAADLAIADLVTTPFVRDSFRANQFGLSTGDALRTMGHHFAEQPEQFALCALYFLPPSLVLAWCAAVADSHERARSLRFARAFATTLAPCSILVVAWDLSRFLCWSAIGGAVALLTAASRGDEPAEAPARARTVSQMAIALLALFSTGPQIYAYFEFASASSDLGPELATRTPGYVLAREFLLLYNRHLFRDGFDSTAKCDVWGDATKKDACTFSLAPGQSVFTRGLFLREGDWVAEVRTSPGVCNAATGTLEVNNELRFGVRRAPVPITSAVTRVPFHVSREDAAMNSTAIAVKGCLALDSIRVTDALAPRRSPDLDVGQHHARR